MTGKWILSAATTLGLLGLGAAARGDDEVPNSPPSITATTTTVNGKAAIAFEITDPDGGADLLGYSYEYTLDGTLIYKNPLQITLWVVGKKGLSASDITNGKRLVFTKLPGNATKLKVTATDSELHQVSTEIAVPSAVAAGNPRFGPSLKPPPKKK